MRTVDNTPLPEIGEVTIARSVRVSCPDTERLIRQTAGVAVALDPDIDLAHVWIRVLKGAGGGGYASPSAQSYFGGQERHHPAGHVFIRSNGVDRDLVQTVAHELRHIGQFARARAAGEKFGTTRGAGYEVYHDHPHEVDARRFAAQVCEQMGMVAEGSATPERTLSPAAKAFIRRLRTVGYCPREIVGMTLADDASVARTEDFVRRFAAIHGELPRRARGLDDPDPFRYYDRVIGALLYQLLRDRDDVTAEPGMGVASGGVLYVLTRFEDLGSWEDEVQRQSDENAARARRRAATATNG